MRICIAGLGGVGGYFGGRLAAAYSASSEHEICFLCRGEHMESIQKKGLKVTTPHESFIAHPHIISDCPQEIGLVDVIFFAVKGYDLPSLAKSVYPLCHDKTLLIPLGNGVDNVDILQKEKLPGIPFNGCVYISAYIESPGVIRQVGGSCKMVVGPLDRDIEKHLPFENMMKNAGILFELVKDIDRAVWTKFIFMSPMAIVTTLKAENFGTVLSAKTSRDLVVDLMKEICYLAKKRNVALPDDAVAKALAQAESFPPHTRSSMELDALKGRSTELETFVGAVVRLAQDEGISLPVYERVYEELLKM